MTRLATTRRTKAATADGSASARLTINPRYLLRLEQQWVRRRGAAGSGPGRVLTTLQCQILYWSLRGETIAQISARVARPLDEVIAAVADLRGSGIVALRPAGRGATAGATRPGRRRHVDTLPWLWRQQRMRYVNRPYMRLRDGGAALTYGEAGALVEAVARRLRAAGVEKGDRVALVAAPHPDAVLVFWAAASIGAIVVPISSELPRPAQRDLLARCAPKIVFAEPPCMEAVDEGVHRVALDAPAGAARPGPSSPGFASWLGARAGPAFDDQHPVEDGDAAVILFTSGSTGSPKGVVLSQGALCRSARLIAAIYEFRSQDVLFSPGDFHSMSGLRNPLLATVAAGASFVLPDRAARHHPLAAVDLVHGHGVTILSVVPTFLKVLAGSTHRLAPELLASVRCILTTAAKLPPTLGERLRALTAAPLCDYYGLTETCGGCIFVRPSEQALARGTIGRPRGVIAQIVDEQGALVPDSGVGELRIYSENVMSGYYREPELTRTVLRDGWLYTGDLVSRNRDGRLILHGRKREIIKDAQGDLIYLAEIEAALEQAPMVAEAAVCSYRDRQDEEQLAAFIRVEPGATQESELVSRLRRMLLTSLGPRKVPQRFVVVADFPRCGNQKVDKRQLVGGLPGHGGV
jgi:acyl-coenzyme A synthetase/AMP-(fatty) acid ligase